MSFFGAKCFRIIPRDRQNQLLASNGSEKKSTARKKKVSLIVVWAPEGTHLMISGELSKSYRITLSDLRKDRKKQLLTQKCMNFQKKSVSRKAKISGTIGIPKAKISGTIPSPQAVAIGTELCDCVRVYVCAGQ